MAICGHSPWRRTVAKAVHSLVFLESASPQLPLTFALLVDSTLHPVCSPVYYFVLLLPINTTLHIADVRDITFQLLVIKDLEFLEKYKANQNSKKKIVIYSVRSGFRLVWLDSDSSYVLYSIFTVEYLQHMKIPGLRYIIP